MSFENGFIRINKENNFVFLTDLFNIANKDIKTFKKTRSCINYIQNNPTHYLSGNNYTDYFGIKVTYGHPKLALLILDWIYKNNCPEKEIFKKYIMNALERIEKYDESEEDDEESDDEESAEESDEEDSEEESETKSCKENNFSLISGKNLILNDIKIIARETDGFINATSLCKAGNKLFANWYKLDSTKNLIKELKISIF